MRLKHVKGAADIIKNGIHYVDNPKDYKGIWSKIFNNNNPIYIEIGMGKGNFIIENALTYSNINFIGIEKEQEFIDLSNRRFNELQDSEKRQKLLDNIKKNDASATVLVNHARKELREMMIEKGIIIVARRIENNTSLPLNFSLANANAAKIVINNETNVDVTPTKTVLIMYLPKSAFVQASI